MKRAPTGSLTPGNKVEEADETAWGSGQFPMNIPVCIPATLALAELPTRVRAAVAEEENAHLGRTEPVQTCHYNLMGQGWPLLTLTEMTDQELSETLTGFPGPCHCVPQPTQGAYCDPTFSSTDPLWGLYAIIRKIENTDLEGMQPA